MAKIAAATCRNCGVPTPLRSPDALDDRCDDCIQKGDLLDKLRYIASMLTEQGVRCVRTACMKDLRAILRNVRHEVQDLEKEIW